MEQKQQCSNCHKEFPVDRIDLHEAYCLRNIRKCQQCQLMIDINEMEQHHSEFHTQKMCEMCSQNVPISMMAAHHQTCPRKPTHCKYCQNSWPLADFPKHVSACGSRTNLCNICNKRIMLKDYDAHVVTCQRRREERAESSLDERRQHGHRRHERGPTERERQRSINMRDLNNGPRPKNKLPDFKPSAIIGPEVIKAPIDPVPISVRLAMKNREGQPRLPLKSKN